MQELLVLEHTEGVGASAFVQVLDSRDSIAPWRRVDVPGGEELPTDPERVAGALVMGGTMSAVDPGRHDWMLSELRWLETALAADVPVFGVCLGAQLLGVTLGGDVQQRATPQAGYLELTRTEVGRTDPVAGGWPDGGTTLFIHEDEVATLPSGAEVLLTDRDAVACWRLGSAVAVQFHPEATAAQVAAWTDSGLIDGLYRRAGVEPAALVEEARRRERWTVPLGRALVGRWFDGPVRDRVSSA